MSETSKPVARVFNYVGDEHPHGWYYQFSGQEPEGPFDTALEAGTRAREVIVAYSERGERRRQ